MKELRTFFRMRDYFRYYTQLNTNVVNKLVEERNIPVSNNNNNKQLIKTSNKMTYH